MNDNIFNQIITPWNVKNDKINKIKIEIKPLECIFKKIKTEKNYLHSLI